MSDVNENINLRQFTVEWASVTVKRFAQSLVKKNVGGSTLKNSFKYQIIQGPDGPSKVIFTYQLAGMFVDMGVGKGQKLGDVKGNKAVYKAAGLHGRVAKKWYSKTMSSETKRLAELMAELFGKQVIAIALDSVPTEINLPM